MVFSSIIAEELKIEEHRIKAALKLMEEGGTVPFIARYRKDQTDNLDEIQLRDIQHRKESLTELSERKETVLKTIEELGKLTPELKTQIDACRDKNLLEDIYAPYKPKRSTRATIAKDKGMEPLAKIIWEQEETSNSAETIAMPFLSVEKGVADPAAAIKFALDILAEDVADNTEFRQYLRAQIEKQGKMVSKVKKEFEGKESKFKNYYDFSEPLGAIPSHRMLAMRRGEKEKILRLTIEVPDEALIGYLCEKVVKRDGVWKPHLEAMCRDSWDRLLKPSLESEVRLSLKEVAELEAFKVFTKNLADILLAPPAGHKSVLALDPGFRSGVKVAVLDLNGKFLDHGVIYPLEPQKEVAKSAAYLTALVEQYDIDLISIGNGTASRETDDFVKEISVKLKNKRGERPVAVIVNESGASVYSASELAIKEFPKEDVTTRGAISIGRRLQDPLAELVKVEAKAIGVGQYQHDVNQKELQKRLDEVVESCVNKVGVDVNSASIALLGYVSGVNKNLAESIVKHRDEKGAFASRESLKDVKGFGQKAFEQAAGFLRIQEAQNPLDNSAVHPENYGLVEKIAEKAGAPLNELIGNATVLQSLSISDFPDVGKNTFEDILSELEKPGRDPRKEFHYAKFNPKIKTMQDLITGSWLEGVVSNVTNFGAFVDIGVHQDGLLHISEM
ncbi:MAG: RNA-binding transcriptional accessory protein, partial [Fibromonadales bacterium]|nr:RNA-binding transcriptional accessory protein [Fibromonadales bacterium]